jgi:hypothetical protein
MECVGNQLNSDRTATFLTKKMHFSTFLAGHYQRPFNEAKRWPEGRMFYFLNRAASKNSNSASRSASGVTWHDWSDGINGGGACGLN